MTVTEWTEGRPVTVREAALFSPHIDVFAIPSEILRRPAWHDDALCREYPDVNFFPERGALLTAAREVCSRCLVKEECLAFGLHEDDGIWGGTSGRERQAIRRTPLRSFRTRIELKVTRSSTHAPSA